jgi:hypothetical protein
MLVKIGPLRRRITAAEVKYMTKTSGYIWTYYKTYRDYKGIKYNHRVGQKTGLQKKLDMTCKQNAL